MKLAQLTTPELIMLDAVFEDRFSAINALTDKLEQTGKLSNKAQFLEPSRQADAISATLVAID